MWEPEPSADKASAIAAMAARVEAVKATEVDGKVRSRCAPRFAMCVCTCVCVCVFLILFALVFVFVCMCVHERVYVVCVCARARVNVRLYE